MAREISSNGAEYMRKDLFYEVAYNIAKGGSNQGSYDTENIFSNKLGEKIYAEKELVDINIQCDGKTFHCHKLVLSCQSQVFKAMIENMIEKESEVLEIDENDISAETMDQFVYFLYHEEFKDIKMINPELLVAADKYVVRDLFDECCKYFQPNLSLQNALGVLVSAEMTNQKDLFEAASRFVCKNIGSLNKTSTYKKLLKNNPTMIANVLSKMIDVKQERLIFCSLRSPQYRAVTPEYRPVSPEYRVVIHENGHVTPEYRPTTPAYNPTSTN
jgi:hypothetical protein